MNKIYNSNCLDVLNEIPNESIDLVVTDCPYKIIAGGVRTEYKDGDKKNYSKTDPKGILSRRPLGVKWQKEGKNISSAVRNGKMFEYNDIEFSEWLPEIFRVLKKGTHCYVMVNARNLCNLQIEAEKVGFIFQNLLVWDKGNATPNKYYMQCSEFILMLSKRPAKNINDMGSKTIISIKNIIGNKKHPTEKPTSLMKILIENSSLVGQTVLDPFAGAGSTLLAAKELRRNYIGCEIDENYYKIALERLNGEFDKGSLI